MYDFELCGACNKNKKNQNNPKRMNIKRFHNGEEIEFSFSKDKKSRACVFIIV